MSRKLKVYGGCFDGATRQIVAAPTKKAAAEALEVSVYHFNEYSCETGNLTELSVALADPGKPFSAPANGPQEAVFVPGLVRYLRGQPWPRSNITGEGK
jgi:hypothetical protein